MNLSKWRNVIKCAILPEILGGNIPSNNLNETEQDEAQDSQDESPDHWCYCRRPELGTMIACDDQA